MGKTNKKLLGIIYPLGIFLFILTIYFCLIITLFFLHPQMFTTKPNLIFSIIYLTIFHILLILIIYCYLVTMFKNPGEPPQFWGFNDRPEERRKRYCMICNKFKPERCHHCSTCGRCVLVMDHHCPWLNNCVGFKNRKVFILLLVYAFTLVCLGLLCSVYPIVLLIIEVVKGDFGHLWILIVGIVGIGLAVVFFVVMVMFLKYHFGLIGKNKTTIEHMDEKRGNVKDYNYDMGKEWNWNSVFGKNKLCWFFPVNTGMAETEGDGTVFMKHYNDDGKRVNLVGQDEPAYFDEDEDKDVWDDGKYNDPLNKHNNNINVKNNPLDNNLDNDVFGNNMF